MQTNANVYIAADEFFPAIIKQAVYDIFSVGKSKREKQVQQDALRWFKGKGREYRYICALSGVDPDYMSKQVLKLYQSVQDGKKRPNFQTY